MTTLTKITRIVFFSIAFALVISLNAFAQKNQKPEFDNSQSIQPAAKAKWTYLIYFAAGNDLGRFMFDNLNEVEETGSTSNVNFVCEAKLQKDNKTKRSYLVDNQGQDVVVRWRLANDRNPQRLNFEQDPRHQKLPYKSTNSASKEELERFIKWAVKTYPAERYGLVLNSHGIGWRGMMADDMFPSGNINGSEFAQTIKNAGIQLEVINFDSCLMGTIETAYDVRKVAKYFVGSQANVPGPGDDYRAVARFLTSNPNADGRQLAVEIVKSFIEKYKKTKSTSTRSAIDLAQLDKIATALNTLSQAISSSNIDVVELTKCAANAPHFDSNGDLMQFIDGLIKVSNPAISQAASNLKTVLKTSILINDYSDGAGGFMPSFRTFENQSIIWTDSGQLELARGLNIYLPVMRMFNMSEFGSKSEIERYRSTDFAKATGWSGIVSKFRTSTQLQADASIDLKLVCQWNANASNADVDFCILEPIPTSTSYSGSLSPYSNDGCIYGEFSKDNLGPGGIGNEWFRFDSGPINRDFQIFAAAQTTTDINVSLTKEGRGKDDGANLFSTVANKSRNYGYGAGVVYLGRVRWNGQGWVYSAPGRTGQWQLLVKAPTKNNNQYTKFEESEPISTPKPDRNIDLEIVKIVQNIYSICI